jgi:hypothetical protein
MIIQKLQAPVIRTVLTDRAVILLAKEAAFFSITCFDKLSKIRGLIKSKWKVSLRHFSLIVHYSTTSIVFKVYSLNLFSIYIKNSYKGKSNR